MSWFDDLQQASFRGVPFGVLGGDSRFGRRLAVHEYPMRDKPYAEDMGRSTRRITVTGFLVENSLIYGGGSAMAQRDAMVAAAEARGPGILIHPTLGQLTVSIPDGGLSVSERWDLGRVFQLGFSFIESGDRLFPSITTSTISFLASLADALDIGAAANFISTLTSSINLGLGIVQGVINIGQAVVGAVVATVADFAVVVGQAQRDATSLFNLASLLTGNYGRYLNANVSSAFASGKATSSPATLPTIATLTAQGAQNSAAVTASIAALSAAADIIDKSTINAFPAAAQSVTSTLGNAIVNPGDAVRIFNSLASFSPPFVAPGSGQTQSAQILAQQATAALLRRAAIGMLARAASQYVPSSYDDAVTVRNVVASAIDAETMIAGDAGDDATYDALRALRQSVVANLLAGSAGLSSLQQFNLNASLPSLTLANRLYQDASRSDQLISQIDPIHPAFCPHSFRALAS